MLLTGWCPPGSAGQRLSLNLCGAQGMPQRRPQTPCAVTRCGEEIHPSLSSEPHQTRRLPPARTSRRDGHQTQSPLCSVFVKCPRPPVPTPAAVRWSRGHPRGQRAAWLPPAALHWVRRRCPCAAGGAVPGGRDAGGAAPKVCPVPAASILLQRHREPQARPPRPGPPVPGAHQCGGRR